MFFLSIAPSQLLHFTSHSLKAELVCSHDSVLFLLGIWHIWEEDCGDRLSLLCSRVK